MVKRVIATICRLTLALVLILMVCQNPVCGEEQSILKDSIPSLFDDSQGSDLHRMSDDGFKTSAYTKSHNTNGNGLKEMSNRLNKPHMIHSAFIMSFKGNDVRDKTLADSKIFIGNDTTEFS